MHVEEIKLAWQYMDVNHDGVLDYSEVRTALYSVPPFEYRVVDGQLQRRCRRWIKGRWFEPTVITLIVANCVLMAAEDPRCRWAIDIPESRHRRHGNILCRHGHAGRP